MVDKAQQKAAATQAGKALRQSDRKKISDKDFTGDFLTTETYINMDSGIDYGSVLDSYDSLNWDAVIIKIFDVFYSSCQNNIFILVDHIHKLDSQSLIFFNDIFSIKIKKFIYNNLHLFYFLKNSITLLNGFIKKLKPSRDSLYKLGYTIKQIDVLFQYMKKQVEHNSMYLIRYPFGRIDESDIALTGGEIIGYMNICPHLIQN